MLSESVPELIRQSLHKELIAAGFNTDHPNGIKIIGKVDQFMYDWIGVESDMHLNISYQVLKDGKLIYLTTITSHKASTRTAAYESEATRAIIADNLGRMLKELRANKIL